MSDHDAYRDEMGRFFRMSDRDLDRLLAGKAPRDDEELAEFAAFLREVKAAHLKFPPESTEARQLAAILEAAQLQSDKGDPAARPASKAPGPAGSGIPESQASRLPNWRRNPMPAGLFSTMWTKAAVAAVAAMLVCCGLAAAGALPDPLQTAAANAAGEVGVAIDNPGDTDEAGDVDAADDSEAADDNDDAAKDDDDAKAANRDDGDDGDTGDSHPVSASNGTPAPAAVVNTPAPADDNDDAEDKDDDHANSAPAAKDDDDNEADDDNNQADEDEADEDHDQADDEGPGDEDHEGGSDEGGSDD